MPLVNSLITKKNNNNQYAKAFRVCSALSQYRTSYIHKKACLLFRLASWRLKAIRSDESRLLTASNKIDLKYETPFIILILGVWRDASSTYTHFRMHRQRHPFEPKTMQKHKRIKFGATLILSKKNISSRKLIYSHLVCPCATLYI